MSALPPAEHKAEYVQGVFARIAGRYDLMNRLMTGGQDIAWRREVIRRADLKPGSRLLDLGAGTGDLTAEALRQQPDCIPTAADFTLEMMLAGRRSRPGLAQSAAWTAADALDLPFASGSFDALVSGFLLRNVADLPRALKEQYRVLKPGGRWVCLDTTPPPSRSLLTPFIRFHMRRVIPALGALLTGQRDAYIYLPSSSERFLPAEELAARLQEVGFTLVGFRKRLFGVVAVHWGFK